MSKNESKSLKISVEQAKLLGSALRIKIITAIENDPKTSKQVAVEINESPGNVHYHMKKLYEGDLIELVEEKQVGGVVQKFYLARATTFSSDHEVYPELQTGSKAESKGSLSAALLLKEEDQQELLDEFRDLIAKWVKKTNDKDVQDVEEFVIGVKLFQRDTNSK